MRRLFAFLCVSCCLCAGLLFSRRASADDVAERAKRLHFSSIVLDTHDDTTQRFFSKDYDIGKRNPDGHTMGPPAVQKALDQIDAVHENVSRNSKDLVFCRTAAEVREAHKQGKIAALMG